MFPISINIHKQKHLTMAVTSECALYNSLMHENARRHPSFSKLTFHTHPNTQRDPYTQSNFTRRRKYVLKYRALYITVARFYFKQQFVSFD